MPKQTRDTELPKPPAPPLDWVKIARSGRVWDFIEGEDFTGDVKRFAARLKTNARKVGVDFESRAVEKDGHPTVLKVLASEMAAKPAAPQTGEGDERERDQAKAAKPEEREHQFA